MEKSACGTTVLSRPALSARVAQREGLTDREVSSMYQLLCRHFEGVEWPVFLNDLAAKNWVVLLEDERGALRGFSTFLIYDSAACGPTVTVVYSGDTIVEPAAWGTSALPRAWIQAIYRLRGAYHGRELYWLLLTSGFRTYRFMSVFCRAFYPRFDQPTPAATQRTLDALSSERFGPCYDRTLGVVCLPRPQRLRGRLRTMAEGRADDPHVHFFLQRNPGHASGDELVSLTSLAPDNLTGAGQRMLR